MRNVSSLSSRIQILGSQLLLFVRAEETVGSGTLLEEICDWEQALEFDSLIKLPVLPLLPVCGYNVIIQLPALAAIPSSPIATSSLSMSFGPVRQNAPSCFLS